MDMQAIEVTLTKMDIKAGDTLVVTTEQHLHREQRAGIAAHFEKLVGQDVKIAILEGGLTLTAILTPVGGGSKV